MKNKGITLIALVITIIVLIILAGVTLNLSLGENGLFNKAQMAVEDYKKEAAREKLELAILELTKNKQRNPKLSELNEINKKDIEITKKQDGSVEIYLEGQKNYALTKVDGYYFKVYDDMTVEFFRELTPEENKEPEYIKEGLVVWYDGINNTRTGHSDTTNIWENLVEDANNGTLKNIDFNNVSGWTDNSLILDGVNDWVQMTYLENENITIEIVAKPLDVDVSKYQMYITNGESGGIVIWKKPNNYIAAEAYSKTLKEYDGAVSNEGIRIGQIYSMSAAYDGNIMRFTENGNMYEKEEPNLVLKPENSTIYAIGTNPSGDTESLLSGNARSNIEVYSVRIYNRALSQEEIQHNYQIDKERFDIEKLPEQEELGYIKDGLICLYDGKQNTKYGHSNKTGVWQNLVGTDINGTLKNIDFNNLSGWTDNSLILDGANDWAILDTFMHYSNMTIEMVVKPLTIKGTASTSYIEYYLTNIEVGGMGLYKSSNNKIGATAYIGGAYKYTISDNLGNVGTVYSLSTGYNGSELYFRENGDMYKNQVTGSFTKPDDSTRFALATNPEGASETLTSGAARSNIEVYSVRIYNRCLTEEEIQANYLIDKQRFNIQ